MTESARSFRPLLWIPALVAMGAVAWALFVPPPAATAPWGSHGHEMAARAALETLPEGMPPFFFEGADQLIWLNPEPDRWRDRRYPEMDRAFQYDHYLDLENIPGTILEESTDRWDFFRRLMEAGVERPEVAVGFAPFAVLELYQRMELGFLRWRAAEDPQTRRWIEVGILRDAGILGHFVTDLSQPHHSTIHFNGWDTTRVPNPEGYDTQPGIHARFESRFVQTHLQFADVRDRMTGDPRFLEDPRGAIWRHVLDSNAQVEPLYRVDRDHGFGPETPPDPVSVDFAARRIAVGAEMLRDLWWSAWRATEP
jgi:hypothetical protein